MVITSGKRPSVSPLFDQNHHENAIGAKSVILHNDSEILLSHHGSDSSMNYRTSESEPKGRRWHHKLQKHKAKSKHNLQSQLGECSSSSSEVSEFAGLQSSSKSLKPKRAWECNREMSGASSQPVSEADKTNFPCYFQEESCGGDNAPSAKRNQLESDEKLARQLQEQYDHEQSGLDGTEETDANMAWSLQQREASHSASANCYQSHPRDASMAHLYMHGQRPSFREYSEELRNRVHVSSSRTAQSRRNFHNPAMDLEMTVLAEVRRNFNNGGMDVETKAHLFEALEAAFDIDQEMEFLDEHDTDDYEMLSTLDEHNFQHSGASESQINSLPESVIQGNSSREEACPICLESPNPGDAMRHLPCLHKYHKECIDTWLRRKVSCPVCKTDIF